MTKTKTKYTALVSFVVDIEADTREDAEYIASRATPTHFNFMSGRCGSGKFKKALAPMIMLAGGEV